MTIIDYTDRRNATLIKGKLKLLLGIRQVLLLLPLAAEFVSLLFQIPAFLSSAVALASTAPSLQLSFASYLLFQSAYQYSEAETRKTKQDNFAEQ
jgi:hypothetical protein